MSTNLKSWKDIHSVEDVRYLIDVGIIITQEDAAIIKKVIPAQYNLEIIAHFAERLAERYHDRDTAGVLLESFFLWLGKNLTEENAACFLEHIFEQPHRLDIIASFPQMCLSLEPVSRQTKELIFDISIFLIAQMGIQIELLAEKYPQEFPHHHTTVRTLSAYMISVSNESSLRVRMCLLNYFGVMHTYRDKSQSFNKVMERFGSTLLNQLFSDLFENPKQTYVFMYLMENLPYVLMAESYIQHTLQDILRHNMLKYPQKFSMFLKVFSHEIAYPKECTPAQHIHITDNFLKHLSLLLVVVSNLDQALVAKEIILAVVSHKHSPHITTMLHLLRHSEQVDEMYINVLEKCLNTPKPREYLEKLGRFKPSRKHKRPPALSKTPCGIFEQIFHDHSSLLKAS